MSKCLVEKRDNFGNELSRHSVHLHETLEIGADWLVDLDLFKFGLFPYALHPHHMSFQVIPPCLIPWLIFLKWLKIKLMLKIREIPPELFLLDSNQSIYILHILLGIGIF
jgi:hypothetical protein